MSAQDHAIVVGIANYPNLDPLSGPENDARAFAAWLQALDGGQVPEENIDCILSSDPLPPGAPASPEPTDLKLDIAFERLIDASQDKGGVGGRRLYVYLAGHGCSPTIDDVLLLAVNAAPKRTGHHLAGRLVANWFRKAAFFEEIVLIMDCCRENYPRINARLPPWEDINGRRPVRFLYAYGTQYGQASREGLDPETNQVRGLFTLALLAGLRSADRDASGRLRTSALEGFVYNYMQQRAPTLVGAPVQDPEFDYRRNREIVFDAVGPILARPMWTVEVELTGANKGLPLALVDGDGNELAPQTMGPVNWRWDSLHDGLYRLRLNGQGAKFFELLGEAKVHRETL